METVFCSYSVCRIASFGLCLFSVLFYTSRVFAVTVGQRTLFRTMSSDECYSDEDFEDDFEDEQDYDS
mgnify:CR=1 FL=1